MKAFATLLDALVYTSSRNAKIKLLADYFAAAPDPDRGYALAALTGELGLKQATASRLKAVIAGKVDEQLFQLSYDFVGDLAETVSLLWPEPLDLESHSLSQLIQTLGPLKGKAVEREIEAKLNGLDQTQRWAFLKLMTGGLRVGVSARLAKTALAHWAGKDVAEIEEIWFALASPYADLFAWLEGKAERPDSSALTLFRPVMLAHPLDEADLANFDPSQWCIEWKWDGARVQLCSDGRDLRLYSRAGEDMTAAFPEFQDLKFEGVIEGEILARDAKGQLSFNALQSRLNRKTVSAKLRAEVPVFVRLYDCLFERQSDLRDQPIAKRKQALERMASILAPDLADVSQTVSGNDWQALDEIRQANQQPAVEGFMLKRWDSPYVAGRPKGPWFKWKRDPFLVDAVLIYAQRGHGKRSSYFSDYTFGALDFGPDQPEPWVVPIGKAYSGMDDAEMKRIDKFVKENTIDRFGPVRAVKPGLVFEIAFEGIQESKRHKSGIGLRFPRIHRIRWDKPWQEADTLEGLKGML